MSQTWDVDVSISTMKRPFSPGSESEVQMLLSWEQSKAMTILESDGCDATAHE